MPFKIKQESGKYIMEMENEPSLWNLLKETTDAPYLKSFVVENYEGGNTLVPRNLWEREEVMYREIDKDVFLFPYESVGFVFDDSIDEADIYVIENYKEKMDYKKSSLVSLSIKGSNKLIVSVRDSLPVYSLAAIYLMAMLKTNYNTEIIYSLTSTLKTIITPKTTDMEYMEGTLTVGLKGMAFIVKAIQEDGKEQFYQLFLDKKFKKKSVREKDIKKLGYLKKKVIGDKLWKKLLYFGIIVILPLSLVVILPKIFDSLGKYTVIKYVGLYFFVIIFYKILRWLVRLIYMRNAHKKKA